MEVIRLTRTLLERFVLADFLPVYAYDRESGVYILSSAVGVVFEVSQVWGGPTVVDALKGLYYQDFPPGTAIQYTLYASPVVRYLADAYVLLREKAGAGRDFIETAKKRREFITEGARRSILRGYDFRIRNFKHIVTLIVPCDPTPAGYDEGIKLISRIKPSVYQALNVAHLNPRDMGPSRYVTVLSELINPSHNHDEMQHYDEKTLIREQICFSDTDLIVEKDHMILDGKYVRSLTVRQYPEKWDVSETVNYVGSLYDNVRQIPGVFYITMNTEYPDKVKTLTQVQQKQMVTSYQLFGPIAKWFPELGEKKTHLDRYLASMRTGDAPVYAYMNIILYADSHEELENKTSLAMNLFRSLGFILQIDNYITFPLFVQSLPL
ncbi:MAG: TraC family protein, partial [Thermofilum sp.]